MLQTERGTLRSQQIPAPKPAPITRHAMPVQGTESIVRYDTNVIPRDSESCAGRPTKVERSGGATAFFCSTESLFLRQELDFLELVKTRRSAKIL